MNLRRVTIERQPGGTWKLVRERDELGETFYCDDLIEAFAYVRRAYLPNGEPRSWPSESNSDGTGEKR